MFNMYTWGAAFLGSWMWLFVSAGLYIFTWEPFWFQLYLFIAILIVGVVGLAHSILKQEKLEKQAAAIAYMEQLRKDEEYAERRKDFDAYYARMRGDA